MWKLTSEMWLVDGALVDRYGLSRDRCYRIKDGVGSYSGCYRKAAWERRCEGWVIAVEMHLAAFGAEFNARSSAWSCQFLP